MAAPRTKQPRKQPWSRPLADLVGPIIDPALARRGFGQSDIILCWDEIVGERLAATSQPVKLQWPPRPRGGPVGDGGLAPAALVIRVETGFALELQHLSGIVIERVNAHLGWRCVDRLLLKQGPIERRPARPARKPPDPVIMNAVEASMKEIADEALRKALTRLGACVLTRASAHER